MKQFLVILLLPCCVWAVADDAVHPAWQTEIPRIVHPDAQLVALYEKTWALAAERVRKGPPGLPASPYLDEHCYDDQIWIWDSCFMVLFSKYAPHAFPGKETLTNLYAPIHDHASTPLKIHLRDNPPLFAWIENENFRFTGDDHRARFVLEEKQYLQKHFSFFDSVPKGSRDACSPQPIFRDVVHDEKTGAIIGYTWTGGASGMDNTPRGREAGGYSKILWIDAIAQQALSALHIARMAETLRLPALARSWHERYEQLKATINTRYWDARDGFYYDVAVDSGKPCRVKTLASYWVLLAEIPSREQATRMVRFLKDENVFGGVRPLPSLARDDRDFNGETGDYWRGGIWLPTSYMTVKALERYGEYALADDLARRIVALQKRTYFAVEPQTIWECYSPGADMPSTEHGRRARQDFCGWSALGPISLVIENVLGFRSANALTGTLVWDVTSENGTHGIKNLRFGAWRVDALYDAVTRHVRITTNRPLTLVLNGTVRHVACDETFVLP